MFLKFPDDASAALGSLVESRALGGAGPPGLSAADLRGAGRPDTHC